MTSVAMIWGSTIEERAMPFPCDALIEDASTSMFRAVDIHAPPRVVFRWLCQLRVAPYSYDWLDNLGRQSPRQLTPGLEHLERGQRVMTIFELTDFEVDRHLTMVLASRSMLFGQLALSYLIVPTALGVRLVAKLRLRSPGVWGALRAKALAWGDLVMMRKQLLTLKALAERDA